MTSATTTKLTVIELMTLAEAARRIGVCLNTLRRRVAKSGVTPDAILLEGSTQRRSPLFVAARLPELKKLIQS
ncbi:MAG TPA: hypothetical protein VN516_01695 [Candidatus Baltobacteraceae bacterium]|nr:hypothetical protein [Candidatus Baltobacteraceae bacterium]